MFFPVIMGSSRTMSPQKKAQKKDKPRNKIQKRQDLLHAHSQGEARIQTKATTAYKNEKPKSRKSDRSHKRHTSCRKHKSQSGRKSHKRRKNKTLRSTERQNSKSNCDYTTTGCSSRKPGAYLQLPVRCCDSCKHNQLESFLSFLFVRWHNCSSALGSSVRLAGGLFHHWEWIAPNKAGNKTPQEMHAGFKAGQRLKKGLQYVQTTPPLTCSLHVSTQVCFLSRNG